MTENKKTRRSSIAKAFKNLFNDTKPNTQTQEYTSEFLLERSESVQVQRSTQSDFFVTSVLGEAKSKSLVELNGNIYPSVEENWESKEFEGNPEYSKWRKQIIAALKNEPNYALIGPDMELLTRDTILQGQTLKR